MAKIIKEERLRWVLPIVKKEIKLMDAAKVCPYGQRNLERWGAAYKRLGDKCRLKDGVQNGKYGVMQNSISYGGLMNMARFWIFNPKAAIRAMSISLCNQIAVQFEKILFNIALKNLDIFSVSFVAFECVPCSKKIFD